MNNLLSYARKLGCSVSYDYAGCSTSIPEAGIITLQPGQTDDQELMDLAHELGHIITYMNGDSERRFPHLRLFRKKRRYFFNSKRFMETVYEEEKEAWDVARELLRDFEYIPNNFEEYKNKQLETYRKSIKCTR